MHTAGFSKILFGALVSLILITTTFAGEAVHFNPVHATGQSQPVILQSAQINGQPLKPGDEVGIFDDSLCVGAASFDSTYNFIIIIWQEVKLPGNIRKPGSRKGYPMRFKVWQQNSATEGNAAPAYESGSAGVFGELLTVITLLEGTCTVDEMPLNTAVYFYPNPFYPEKDSGIIRYTLNKADNVTIKIYDTAGSLVKTILENEPNPEAVEIFTPWDGRDQNGDFVANGAYIYSIESKTGFQATGKIAVFR
ncbi:MAG: FlgD immunoglobulin-like domain containing protein [Methanosarcinaceae archaeon]